MCALVNRELCVRFEPGKSGDWRIKNPFSSAASLSKTAQGTFLKNKKNNKEFKLQPFSVSLNLHPHQASRFRENQDKVHVLGVVVINNHPIPYLLSKVKVLYFTVQSKVVFIIYYY